MNGLGAALRCEALKARRSKVPLLTGVGFSLAPAMAALFMVVMKDPERARRLGLITAKAQLFAGAADWPTYLGVIAQATAVGGLLLFSLLAAWIFGREFADRTAKTLLALPTSRETIVLAKLTTLLALCLLITGWILLLALGLGAALGLPGGSPAVIAGGVARAAGAGLMTALLVTPVAFMAGVGRGYIAPLAFALLLMFLSQVLAAAGWGGWFPWAVPALYSGAAGPPDELIGAHSLVLVALTGAAGAAITVLWWRVADQPR